MFCGTSALVKFTTATKEKMHGELTYLIEAVEILDLRDSEKAMNSDELDLPRLSDGDWLKRSKKVNKWIERNRNQEKRSSSGTHLLELERTKN